MKCLSIRQPWAWAIVESLKPIENRSWSTSYRGPVLIHAGVKNDLREWDDCMDLLDEVQPLHRILALSRRARALHQPSAQRGGIVGIADLVACVTEHDSPWFFGKFGFVLANARRVPFVPMKGRLGLFNVEWPR